MWENCTLAGSSLSLMNKIWKLLRKPLLGVDILLFLLSADHEAPGRAVFTSYGGRMEDRGRLLRKHGRHNNKGTSVESP